MESVAPDIILCNAAVPASLVRDAARFGGRVEADCLVGDLVIGKGKVIGLVQSDATPMGTRTIDFAGRIVLPKLTEAHCHLDKCHTVARLGPVGGDLRAAGQVQQDDKANYTEDDIRARAARGIDEFLQAGCGTVRTHVDWGAEGVPMAWSVLGELAQDLRGQIDIELSALISLERFDDPDYANAAARTIAASDGVLGAFVYDHANKARRLRGVIDLAARQGLALDFHVDEGLDPGLDGLVAIAGLIEETGFDAPVLCGHACSLMNLDGTELASAIEAVRRSSMAVVSLPTTNLYLQGRRAGTPDRRGVTRVHELVEAGVTVAFGTDNVGDAFCPIGRHDPMMSLATAALSAHLDPPYGPWLRAVTTDAQRAIGQAPTFIDGADVSSLLVADARTTSDLVTGGTRTSLTKFFTADKSQPLLRGEG